MTDAALRVDYLTHEELVGVWRSDADDILGIAAFAAAGLGGDTAADAIALLDDRIARRAARQPLIRVPCPLLGGVTRLYEVWRAREPPGERRRLGAVDCRDNGQFLFGCLELDDIGLATTTQRAYGEVFGCLEKLGFPHLLRVWNYFPSITGSERQGDACGEQRYHRFNEGRQAAFRAWERGVRGGVPAASALGLGPTGRFVLYFLASVQAGMSIENPRQVPAYDYPREYGEFSPTFSRATATCGGNLPMLFVSGTASIVGSASVHVGDLRAQSREIVANLRTVTDAASGGAAGHRFAADTLYYKVYLRNPADREPVEAELVAGLSPRHAIVWLGADVCRADLLLEVEAAGRGISG